MRNKKTRRRRRKKRWRSRKRRQKDEEEGRMGMRRRTRRRRLSTYPHVFVEAGGLAEGFCTHHTFVRAVFLVDMQNVDTKAVALLKRPDCTQKIVYFSIYKNVMIY
jgi:hypothetical protein